MKIDRIAYCMNEETKLLDIYRHNIKIHSEQIKIKNTFVGL